MTTNQTTASRSNGASDDETALVADGVTREFGSVTVVKDVSLTVRRGELHALIGPNGSGKTTLLELLAGIRQPTTGTVRVEAETQPRTIGYLPQRPEFRPSFTALETLTFYASLVDDDPEALLSRVGLSDAANRRVEDLSGGMTRLLALGQALAGDPPIVLLDEPGSGLDPGMRARMIDIARSLAAEGAAVLYSTHDLALAEQHCDRISLVDAGHVVETAPPEALLTDHDTTTLRGVFEGVAGGSDDAVTVLGADR
ncbi:ATP-binding cassette domain-containing protein [Halovenus sp. WSH3]|uniref:ATP-binding cassette domain-containing protein n=1 Tax=Halovenus carboxidivorans TaxID=2692199 RepID=A0A6B0T110_9EURY|nr:ABC transporter ATP-binding protein [Halovenus carboxidivorans]MXR51595.1 ATP-binding cassette domain-containing protein [Halovenus carboxidivorans]